MKMQNFTLVLLILYAVQSRAQSVVLNEVCSKNDHLLLDEDGDKSDWIELYNSSTYAYLNLEGYALSDDDTKPRQWLFPNIVLPLGGHLLVWASEKNRVGTQLHTNFKISQEGEAVVLFAPNGTVQDRIVVPYLAPDYSHGRSSDGSSDWVCFDQASPSADNQTGHSLAYCALPLPLCNHPEGFYNQSLDLVLSSPVAGAEIHYTTNGAVPTLNSPLYTDTLRIDTTFVLRAQAYAQGFRASGVLTQTFWFNQVSSRLPIVSLVSDPRLLFSADTGIFVLGLHADPDYPYYGANFWQGWEVPTAVSFHESSFDTVAFSGTFDMAIQGGSVARTRPQKVVRLLAKSKYGLPILNYQLFPDHPEKQFKHFVLRNAGSDFNQGQCRDAVIHRLCTRYGLKQYVNAYRPVRVYVNGQYWGIQDLREKMDDYFIWSHTGLAENEIDFLEEDTVVLSGSTNQFRHFFDTLRQGDANTDAWYQLFSSGLDWEGFTDYFITETYFNNYDWPYNNLKFWRPKRNDGRWAYLMFDLDVALGGQPWCHYTEDLLGFLNTSYFDANLHVKLLRRCHENTSFHNYFINRYADLINTAFSADSASAVISALATELRPEMPLHAARWAGDVAHWKDVMENEILTYVRERPAYQRRFIRNLYQAGEEVSLALQTQPTGQGHLDINTLKLGANEWTGVYFSAIPVTITAHVPAGYVFAGWTLDDVWQTNNDTIWTNAFTKNSNIVAHFVTPEVFNNELTLYPNPVSDWLNVETNAPTEGEFRVYNGLGQLTKQVFTASSRVFGVNVADLPDGVYFYTYLSNRRTYEGKFLVSKTK